MAFTTCNTNRVDNNIYYTYYCMVYHNTYYSVIYQAPYKRENTFEQWHNAVWFSSFRDISRKTNHTLARPVDYLVVSATIATFN